MSKISPSPRFTGIFIPAEILDLHNLTFFEMILLSWIDALYCPQHGGCYASNEYLGSKLKGAQPNTVAKALTNLRKKGLIEDVSFDGRTRVIRALINRFVDEAQSKSPLDIPPTPIGYSSNHELDNGPSSPYIENKEENKDKNTAQTASRLRQEPPDISFSFEQKKFLGITESDISKWKEVYSGIDVIRELKRMVDWALSERSKAKNKKKWRKFITNWLQNDYDKASNKAAYRQQKGKSLIDDHKVNEKYWGGKPSPGAGKRKILDCSEDL